MSPNRPFRRTPLSIQVLEQILDAKGWSQYDLAKESGVHRSTVSMHFSRSRRPIRDEHLTGYLRVLHPNERKTLLAAWLRDVLGSDVVDDIVDPATNRVREEIVDWAPAVRPSDKKMLAWLSHEMLTDPELAEMVRSLCSRLGFADA